ncbi:MAG: hypothetical protein JWM31_230, partial [Solirubrobacterales bacterium]|nr:hypothetical protein [Solirubrobacterales bacterium]
MSLAQLVASGLSKDQVGHAARSGRLQALGVGV